MSDEAVRQKMVDDVREAMRQAHAAEMARRAAMTPDELAAYEAERERRRKAFADYVALAAGWEKDGLDQHVFGVERVTHVGGSIYYRATCGCQQYRSELQAYPEGAVQAWRTHTAKAATVNDGEAADGTG